MIADCVRSDRTPGSVVVLRDDEVPAFFRTKLSPRRSASPTYFATLRFLGARAAMHTVVVGVEPQSLATGMSLSSAVRAALPLAEEALLDALADGGCALAALQEAA